MMGGKTLDNTMPFQKMTDIDSLIHDLRSRINPAYADTLGTESYERKQCAVALEEQRNNIVLFATELERLRCLLHDSRYTDSKDWRESGLAGRIEWLITMYESVKDEIERLEVALIEIGMTPDEARAGVVRSQAKDDEIQRLQAEVDRARADERQAMAYLNTVKNIIGADDYPDVIERVRKQQAEKEHYIDKWSDVCDENQGRRKELDRLREALRRLYQWAYTMAGYGLEHTGDHPLAVAKTMLEAAPKTGDQP